MNELLERYFASKDDIIDVLAFLHEIKRYSWDKVDKAEEKLFDLFETELFVLSHLDDKNLSNDDFAILSAFIESPNFYNDFQQALNLSKYELLQSQKKIGHDFDFELSISVQKLDEISELFSELDREVQKLILQRNLALH